MKVLIVGPLPNPVNGCSYSNQVLAAGLKQKGIPISVVNTSARRDGSDRGKFSLQKVTSFLKTYWFILKISWADAVYYTPGQTYYGLIKYAPFILLCILLRKPYVIHVHGNHLGTEYASLTGSKRKFFYYLVSHAAAGIVLSASLKKDFAGLLHERKVFVVVNFVDQSLHELQVVKQSDKLRILYLSSLMKEKGIFELLDALLQLQKKGIEFEAVIAGSIEAQLEEDLRLLFSTFSTGFQYIGTIAGGGKSKRLRDANVLVLPTYYNMEGQPIAILEGLATGNIIISTNHAGIPDVVSDKNGFMVKPKSSADIQSRLEEISANLPAMVEKFSGTNRTYASNNFTVSNFTNAILSILSDSSKS